ncbi:lysophospholipid acyltransferase family protein [Chloroflexota bacterium]
MDIRYRVLRLAAKTARFMPIWLGYYLAILCGDILFLLSAKRRKIVSDNIKRVPGLESDKGRKRAAIRGVFKHMAKNYFDLTKLSQLRLDKLEENVTIEGWHHLGDAVTEGRGTIIASAHLGNFDVAARILVLRGINMTIFVEDFNSTPFLRNVAKLRQRNGARTIQVNKGALREALQILRHGGTIGIACDRDIQENGLKVNFFGEVTSLPVGAVSLALRTGAAIVPIFSVRQSNNRYSIYIEPPLRLGGNGNRSHSLREGLEKLTSIMERYIREYPEQWVVLEPIWRNQVAVVDPNPI